MRKNDIISSDDNTKKLNIYKVVIFIVRYNNKIIG